MKDTLLITRYGPTVVLMISLGVLAFTTVSSAQVTTTTASSTNSTSAASTTNSGSSAVQPTCTLVASPTQLIPGGATTLSWTSSSNVNLLTLNNDINTVSPVLGSIMVSPAVTTTYTATAHSSTDTTTCSATVTVMSVAMATSTKMMASSTTGNSMTTSMTPSFNGSNIVDINANGSKPGMLANPSISFTGTTQTTTTTQGTSSTPTMVSYPSTGSTPAPMIVTIGTNGNALVRGVVLATASDGMIIQSWGGWWFVRAGSARIASLASDLASIKTGDFVGVQGTVSASKPYSIDADFVRDWTTTPYVSSVSMRTVSTTNTMQRSDAMSTTTNQ